MITVTQPFAKQPIPCGWIIIGRGGIGADEGGGGGVDEGGGGGGWPFTKIRTTA